MLSVKRCTSSELFMVAQINSQGQHRTNSTLNSAVRKQKPPLPCPLQVLSRRSGGAEGRGPTRPKRHTHNASYRSVDSIPERALFSVSLSLSVLSVAPWRAACTSVVLTSVVEVYLDASFTRLRARSFLRLLLLLCLSRGQTVVCLLFDHWLGSRGLLPFITLTKCSNFFSPTDNDAL